MSRAPILVLRRFPLYRRRAPAARRMAALGYGVRDIARLLGLSRRRVRDALADVAANGRVWTARERAALARETGNLGSDPEKVARQIARERAVTRCLQGRVE